MLFPPYLMAASIKPHSFHRFDTNNQMQLPKHCHMATTIPSKPIYLLSPYPSLWALSPEHTRHSAYSQKKQTGEQGFLV